MISDFGNVFIFIVLGFFFAFFGLITAKLIGPSRPNTEKNTTYECGEDAIGSSWVQFNIRFYVIALIFIIFDVEILFLFPWATVYKGLGLFGFMEMLVFVGILLVGLAYAWAKGDLEWVRPEINLPKMPVRPESKKSVSPSSTLVN
jgi:NADH-quinone oxidoreductase subunit A